ncbi:MAG: PepSY domain-containing protein [Rhodanobacter sp.]
MKKLILALTIAALAATTFVASAETSTAELGKLAKIQMPQAREIALKAYPGKIVKEELEQEKGGSGLRYSFDIANGKITHEVGVDAKTGKLLENSIEGADND